MRKILPAIWASPLSLAPKLGATFQLGIGAFGPLSVIVLITAVIEILFGGGLSHAAGVMIALVAAEMICGPALLQLAGQILTRRAGLFAELAHIPVVLALQLVVGLAGMLGWVRAILGGNLVWDRTVKRGTMDDALDTGMDGR